MVVLWGKNKKYRYLLKNFGILTISSFGSKILAFLLVPIYTRYLTTEEYGTFDLYTTTVTLLVPVLTLNIAESVLRFSLDKSYNIKEIWSIGLKYSSISCMLLAIIIIINHKYQLVPILDELNLELFILFLGTFFYDLFSKFARGIDKVKNVGIAGIINSIVLLSLNIILLTKFNLGLKGYLWAYCMSYLCPILYYFFSLEIWNYFTLKISNKSSIEMVRYSAPLILDTVGWWVNNASDRYIVTWICGVAVNGIYSVSYKIPSILNMINSIFGQAWTLSAVKEFDNDDLRDVFYTNIYRIYNCCMVLVCSALIIFDKVIAQLLFANDFYSAWQYAPFLMISVVFSALMTVMGGVFLAAKQSKELGMMTAIGAVFNTILNFVFVCIIGSVGAAISTMLTYIFVWIIRLVKIRKISKFDIFIGRDIFSYILLVVQSGLLFVDMNNFILYVTEVIVLINISILYKKDIMRIVQIFKLRGKNMNID